MAIHRCGSAWPIHNGEILGGHVFCTSCLAAIGVVSSWLSSLMPPPAHSLKKRHTPVQAGQIASRYWEELASSHMSSGRAVEDVGQSPPGIDMV